MQMSRTTRLGAVSAGVLLLATSLSACNTAEKTADRPPQAPAASPSASPAKSATADPTASPSAEASPTPGASPQAKPVVGGQTLTGKGYSFTVPTGWRTGDQKPRAYDSFIHPSDNPAASLNVIVQATSQTDAKKFLADAKPVLQNSNVADVAELPTTTVSGVPCVGLTGTVKAASGGTAPKLIQRYMLKDGQSYIITQVIVNPASAAQGQAGLAEVLKTWKFA